MRIPSIAPSPLELAFWMLEAFRTQVRVYHRAELPRGEGCLLVVANHRSFLDAPLLLWGFQHPVHLVSHHYLAQVPLVNQLVEHLGGFHLGPSGRGRYQLFRTAAQYLHQGEHVAIFPEGAELIAQESSPSQGAAFRRGFAHLALRSGLTDLPIVPVAIVSRQEASGPIFPLPLLRMLDSSEPMFQRDGWHPLVIYQRVELHIGVPRRIRSEEIKRYRGGQAATVTAALAQEMQETAHQLTLAGTQHPW
jgi:1-acyl-sn-glycerol-3-phosphate acyltransferase